MRTVSRAFIASASCDRIRWTIGHVDGLPSVDGRQIGVSRCPTGRRRDAVEERRDRLAGAEPDRAVEPVAQLGVGVDAERSVDGRRQVGRACRGGWPGRRPSCPTGRSSGPPRTPAPAKTAENTAAQWSRPSRVLAFPVLVPIRGVRPNSPVTTTSVSSSSPRRFQVVEQGRDALVGRRQQPVLERLEVGRMRVPGLDAPHVDLNDRHAGPRPAAWRAGATGRTCAGRSGRGASGLRRSGRRPGPPCPRATACRPARPARRTGPSRSTARAADLVDAARPAGRAATSADPAARRSSPPAATGLRSRIPAGSGPAGPARGRASGPRNPACWPGQISGPSIRNVGSITPLGMPSARGRIASTADGIARIIVARGDLVEERTRLRMAGQDLVGRVQVVRVRVRQRPDDRQLVGPRRQPRAGARRY